MILIGILLFAYSFLLSRAINCLRMNNYLLSIAINEHGSSNWYCEGFNVDKYIFNPKLWYMWTKKQAYRYYKEGIK